MDAMQVSDSILSDTMTSQINSECFTPTFINISSVSNV